MVIGHSAQLVSQYGPASLQIIGTGDDANVLQARFINGAYAPRYGFLHSRNTWAEMSAGSHKILEDNDPIGYTEWYPDDGVDYTTLAAQFGVEVDDASPAAGDIGTAFTWSQMPGGAGALRETMRLGADGTLTVGGDIGQTGTRVSHIYTTNQTTTNAETVDSWSRSKENIFAYTERALDIIKDVDVIGFSHLTDRDPSGRIKLGVRAESIGEPLALVERDYGHGLGVGPALDTMGLTALNTKAIQELKS